MASPPRRPRPRLLLARSGTAGALPLRLPSQGQANHWQPSEQSGWPDSNRRPPAPKLNLVTERGGLEESCRSTELGSCRQGAFRTSLDSSSLGSHIGSPPPRSDQVRAHVTHLWTAGRIVRLRAL